MKVNPSTSGLEKGEASFIADAMLGSLARKLRIFGFNTLYSKSGTDSEIISLAKNEGRIIITSDRELAEFAERKGVKVLLVFGKDDNERMESLIDQARRKGVELSSGDPLCALCNGELIKIDRYHLKGKVPRNVLDRHREFYTCNSCGKVYWRGRHWTRLRRLMKLFTSSTELVDK